MPLLTFRVFQPLGSLGGCAHAGRKLEHNRGGTRRNRFASGFAAVPVQSTEIDPWGTLVPIPHVGRTEDLGRRKNWFLENALLV
jgi:hypothetical protein